MATDAALPDGNRLVGEGSLEQVRRDLAQLEELGCQYVLLDTFYDDLEAVKHNEAAWSVLAVMAEKVLDLKNQSVQ